MGRWTDVATWAGPIRNSGDPAGAVPLLALRKIST